MYCGGPSLVQSSEGRVCVKPALCRCWSCNTCGPRRQARVEMEIELAKPDTHIVLTLRRVPGGSPEEARARLGKCQAEFFRRLKKLNGAQVERFCVVEKTKLGWPHLHVAARGWKFGKIEKVWALWRSVTGDSDHVRVRRVPARRLKKYLAKYLGKDPHKFGNGKRYWKTAGWLPADWKKPTEEEASQWQGWRYDHRHQSEIVDEYLREGWSAAFDPKFHYTLTFDGRGETRYWWGT